MKYSILYKNDKNIDMYVSLIAQLELGHRVRMHAWFTLQKLVFYLCSSEDCYVSKFHSIHISTFSNFSPKTSYGIIELSFSSQIISLYNPRIFEPPITAMCLFARTCWASLQRNISPILCCNGLKGSTNKSDEFYLGFTHQACICQSPDFRTRLRSVLEPAPVAQQYLSCVTALPLHCTLS